MRAERLGLVRPWYANDMSIADDLKDAEILTPEGETRRLGAYWQERPIVLVFIRHFG